jgi:phage shock protein PspC (stress-responsive transcriptional regulator)
VDTPGLTEADRRREYRRAHPYWQSNKNIAGSAAGILVLVLHFVGALTGWLWFPLVVAAYVVAAIVMPNRRPDRVLVVPGVDADAIRKQLKVAQSAINGRVPVDVQLAVSKVADTLLALLSRLGDVTPGSEEAFVISRVAGDYLPGALRPYMSLPQEYANRHVLPSGKTAHDEVLAQLHLLESSLQGVSESILRGETDALTAHGRFLEQRFSPSELSVGDPGPPNPPRP